MKDQAGIVKAQGATGIIRSGTEYKLEDLEKIAEYFAKSKIFGAWDNKEKIMSLLILSNGQGKNPASIVQDYDPIQSKHGVINVRKKAWAMLRDFFEDGGKVEWQTAMDNSREAIATFTAPNGTVLKDAKYTWEQAVRAGLNDNPAYQKNPADLLRKNLVCRVLRSLWPKATGMFYGEMEFEDEITAPAEPKTIFNTPHVSKEKGEPITVVGEVVSSCNGVEPPVASASSPTTPSAEPPADRKPKHHEIPDRKKSVSSPFLDAMEKLDKDKLNAYLISIKFIKDGENYDKVTGKRQKDILERLESFTKNVNEFKVEGK